VSDRSTANILAVVGSLRKASIHRIIARTIVEELPEGIDLDVLDLADLPLYNGDDEQAGPPSQVRTLVAKATAADGVLIISPEYNSSLPALTKNAIDWLSRPPRTWQGTAVTLIVATGGRRAGLGIRTHLEQILDHQRVRIFPFLGIGTYGDKIADGAVTDPATRAEILDHVRRFAEFSLEPPPVAAGD